MKQILSLILSMSLFARCQQSNSMITEEKNLPSKTILNVSYGKDSLQNMDVYLPANRSTDSTKALILIHGGGWNGGSKMEFASYIDSFRKRMPHYAIFNLNYRLVNGGNLFPTQEIDIKAAVDFIVGKANEYHIDQEQLVLLGASAGGHLALLQAYKYNLPKIKAVIDFFGPTDLVAMYEHPWHPLVPYALKMVTGGAEPVGEPNIYRESSPINFVHTASAPTLIFHGGADNVVDVSQSKSLQQVLERAGVPQKLVVYPKERHGWQGATLSNSFDHIETFLKQYVP